MGIVSRADYIAACFSASLSDTFAGYWTGHQRGGAGRCEEERCAHFGVLKTCEPRDVGALRTDWSPKRPRLTELAHMVAQRAIGVGHAPIVSSEHDTGSASNGRTLIRPRLCRGGRKLVSASVCNVPPAIRQSQNYAARRTPWRRLSSRSGTILWYSSELYQRLNAAVSANQG